VGSTQRKTKRRLGSLIAILALALCVLGSGASAASAATSSMGPISKVFSTSAHLTGNVENPVASTFWRFDYSTNGVDWTLGEGAAAGGPTTSAEEVKGDLSGLKPATEYFVRLAVYDEGTGELTFSPEPNPSFTTTGAVTAKPKVLATEDASALTYTTAKVEGEVERPTGEDPALDATCNFEYITEAAFGVQRSEVQELQITATAGTFTLGFEGQKTTPLAFDAGAATLQGALEALSSVSTGGVSVSGGPGAAAPYKVTFTGPLGNTNVPQLETDGSKLTGIGHALNATTLTDGRAAGFEGATQVACNHNPVTAADPPEVEATLTGLANNTTYHLRLTASNPAGSDSKEAADTFTTQTVTPPLVTIEAAGNVTAAGAHFEGEVIPGEVDPAFNSACHFEYITDADYAARSAQQKLVAQASGGGTFKLGFQGMQTPSLSYNASAEAVQDALQALPGIGAGNVSVAGGPGDNTGSSPYLITFTGALSNTNVPKIDVDGALLSQPASAVVSIVTTGHPEGFEGAQALDCSVNPVQGTGSTAVSAEATGLGANTTYHLRLRAKNAGGDATAVAPNFTTAALPPEAQARPVGNLSSTSALLGGSVDANGSSTVYWIEYADNPAFTGALASPASKDAAAGSGQNPVNVSRSVSGLKPDTDYYFRVVAESAVETVTSNVETFHTHISEIVPGTCPNESLRAENNSLELADCRAYELVSPDLNHASLSSGPSGYSLPSGDTMMYYAVDAPKHANLGSVFNFIAASRDPSTGWAGASLTPPVHGPTAAYFANIPFFVSSDLKSVLTTADQSPDGAPIPPGLHLFVVNANGAYQRISKFGNPFVDFIEGYFGWDTTIAFYDFKTVMLKPAVAQLKGDPSPGSSMYVWRNGELHLLGILPDGTPAPFGSNLPTTVRDVGPAGSTLLPPVSADGTQALFNAYGYEPLFLRSNNTDTVDVTESQRTVEVDPHPIGDRLKTIGVTEDGSQVLFISPVELTNDAYTGRSGGVQTDAGSDLYSYHTATGELTDLTVDTNPADEATGAGVLGVIAATKDASYIYFTATGNLAPGATQGHPALYLWHDGEISFIANTAAVGGGNAITSDAKTIAFSSTARLTGYDNTDPVTGEPHQEVYLAGLGRGLECASCRPDGSPPTGDSVISGGSPYVPGGFTGRSVSDDGTRVFFQSTDTILPGTTPGLTHVFEFSGGQISPISPLAATSDATFLDAGASGRDVFFATHDTLVPNPNGGDGAIYDARVGGGFPQPVTTPRCGSESCRAQGTQGAPSPPIASATFEARGPGIQAPKKLSANGSRVAFRVTVPAKGQLTVTGNSLQKFKLAVPAKGSASVKLALTASAKRTLQRKGKFQTKATLVFRDSSGQSSRATVALTFKPSGKRK
jgi:hypothetical protein